MIKLKMIFFYFPPRKFNFWGVEEILHFEPLYTSIISAHSTLNLNSEQLSNVTEVKIIYYNYLKCVILLYRKQKQIIRIKSLINQYIFGK